MPGSKESTAAFWSWESQTIEADLPAWIASANNEGYSQIGSIGEVINLAQDSRFKSAWAAQEPALAQDILTRTFFITAESVGKVPEDFEHFSGFMTVSLDSNLAFALTNAQNDAAGPKLFFTDRDDETGKGAWGRLELKVDFQYTEYTKKSDGSTVKVPTGAKSSLVVMHDKKQIGTLQHSVDGPAPDNFSSSTDGMEYFSSIGKLLVADIAQSAEEKVFPLLRQATSK